MLAIVTGLTAGFAHVFSGPDHLAAVVPLAVERKNAAWSVGLRWGFGHTAGVLLVGLLAVLTQTMLHANLVSLCSERLVGLVLVAIGLWGLKSAFSKKIHAHEHQHETNQHVHVHWHDTRTTHAPASRSAAHQHTHAAFGVGVLHGLAGSAHLLGVLPALAFGTAADSMSYLAAFAAGTILSMLSTAAAVGFFAQGLFARGIYLQQTLMYLCSFFALGVGVFWMVA